MDVSNWMGQTSALHNRPLTTLHMPGSHDSLSYSITTNLPLSPDDCPSVVYKLRGLPCTKGIVKNWSVTQDLDIAGQLSAGIRYVDVRTAYYSGDGTFRAIHGLYGGITESLLGQIQAWVLAHPKEVVILDFNHFDGFDDNDKLYDALVQIIVRAFDSILIPPSDPSKLTLGSLYSKFNRGGVIVTYQANRGLGHEKLWSGAAISSPWANTNTTAKLFPYLESHLSGRSLGQLFVTQGILTPQTSDIVKHLSGTLKHELAVPATNAVEAWIHTIEVSLKEKLNIVMCDFINSSFSQQVISTN